jgi:TolB-like protein
LLAVLPFENVGDSATAYLADGITNELRGKLSELAHVQVIASGVQWEKLADGTSRVRVSPEAPPPALNRGTRARRSSRPRRAG